MDAVDAGLKVVLAVVEEDYNPRANSGMDVDVDVSESHRAVRALRHVAR